MVYGQMVSPYAINPPSLLHKSTQRLIREHDTTYYVLMVDTLLRSWTSSHAISALSHSTAQNYATHHSEHLQ